MTPEQAAIRRIIGTRFELAYRMAKLITERQRQWARTLRKPTP